MKSVQIASTLQRPPNAIGEGLKQADLVQSRENRRAYLMGQALRSAEPRKLAAPRAAKAPKMGR
jgi:hypothetical protein